MFSIWFTLLVDELVERILFDLVRPCTDQFQDIIRKVWLLLDQVQTSSKNQWWNTRFLLYLQERNFKFVLIHCSELMLKLNHFFFIAVESWNEMLIHLIIKWGTFAACEGLWSFCMILSFCLCKLSACFMKKGQELHYCCL